MIPSLSRRHLALASVRRAPPSRALSSSSSGGGGGGGAGIFARIGSFLVGAGATALATEVYIFAEVREGNLEMLRRQGEIERRLAALEKKK